MVNPLYQEVTRSRPIVKLFMATYLAGIGSPAFDRIGQCHRSTAEADRQSSVLHEEIPSLSLNQR